MELMISVKASCSDAGMVEAIYKNLLVFFIVRETVSGSFGGEHVIGLIFQGFRGIRAMETDGLDCDLMSAVSFAEPHCTY